MVKLVLLNNLYLELVTGQSRGQTAAPHHHHHTPCGSPASPAHCVRSPWLILKTSSLTSKERNTQENWSDLRFWVSLSNLDLSISAQFDICSTEAESKNRKKFKCSMCQVTFTLTHIKKIESHIRGKKHKELALTNDRGKFSCLICEITVYGMKTLQSHILGKKHKKNVRGWHLRLRECKIIGR